MTTVTLSSKYQVVVPKEVRQSLHLKPGQKISFSVSGQTATIKPATTLENLGDKYNGILAKNLNIHVSKLRDEWEEHQDHLDSLRP